MLPWRKPNSRRAAGAVVALGLGGLVYLWASANGPRQQVVSAIPVKTVEVARRDVAHQAEVVGTVESLQSVTIRAQVDGILTAVNFQEGDDIKAGQLLATIDDRALLAAVAGAKGQLARDSAQLNAAERNLERYRNLIARGTITQQAFDQQLATTEQLRASVQISQANLDMAEVNLSYSRIRSPVNGRAGIRRVDVGNMVRPADANGIVSVAQVNPISVVFPAPQTMLAALRASVGVAGGDVAEAIDRETGQTLAVGRITAFDNTIDAASGTAKVRAQFDNSSDRLAPGQFTAVRIRTGLSTNALVVPSSTVRPGLERPFVYRVASGKAERVDVVVGYADDDVTVVSQGLNEGDVLVYDGYSRLKPGTPVKDVERVTPLGPSAATAASGDASGLQALQ